MSNIPRITRRGKVGVSAPIQFVIDTLSPVVENGQVDAEGSAITIQNTGDETVVINGHFTLATGQSLSFGVSDDYNFFSTRLKFTFSGGGVNPRVEIITVQAAIKGYGELTPY